MKYDFQVFHWEHRDISRWPGGWFGPLPCVFIIIIYLFFKLYLFICLLNVPKWSFAIVAFPNKS